MRSARHEKWQTTSNWRNRTTKSRQDENTRRKRDLQILRNLGGWHHQTSRNEKLNYKKNISELENYSRQCSLAANLIKGKNSWAIPLVRYSGPFLKLIRDELRQMDQRIRKLMTMHKALHPTDDVDRIYVPRKERKRTCQNRRQRWHTHTTTRTLHRKTQRRTDYGHQKQY